jgi:hypothetical protein
MRGGGPDITIRIAGRRGPPRGVDDCLEAVAQPELSEHMSEVRLDRCLGEEEPLGNLGVGEAGQRS